MSNRYPRRPIKKVEQKKTDKRSLIFLGAYTVLFLASLYFFSAKNNGSGSKLGKVCLGNDSLRST